VFLTILDRAVDKCRYVCLSVCPSECVCHSREPRANGSICQNTFYTER